MQKTKTVLVKCIVVEEEGGPAVGAHGEPLRDGEKPMYEWDKRRRSMEWLKKHRKGVYWKELPR